MSDRQQFLVHQIYYDESSRRTLDPGFIPLDNTSNERPDWFEFWVIRRFLTDTPLREDAWYGFLSPKFHAKTGLDSNQVFDFLQRFSAQADVALFSYAWDQIAYFLNPFEQGEFWHPGLLDLSQRYFSTIGIDLDLKNLVTHSLTTVFSNFIVAKAEFWRRWLGIANALFELVERGDCGLSAEIGSPTSYVSNRSPFSMKTFIQERFASVLLIQGTFRVVALDLSYNGPIFTHLFRDEFRTRRLLQACDLLKQQYTASGDRDYIHMYRKLRALVPTTSIATAPR